MVISSYTTATFSHLFPKGHDITDLMTRNDLQISAFHYPRSFLERDNVTGHARLPDDYFVTNEKAIKYALKSSDMYNNNYICVPCMSWKEIENNSPTAKNNLKVKKEQKTSARVENTHSSFIAKEHEEIKCQLETATIELQSLKKELIEAKKKNLELETNNKENLESIKLLQHKVIQQSHLIGQGLSRFTILSDSWHESNKDAAHFLFRIGSTWKETKCIITEGFFPGMKIIIPFKLTSPLSDFEKVLISIMRMHCRFKEATLGYIMGKDRSTINRVLDEWIPKLGWIGRSLSILDLDLTHDYVSKEDAEKYNLPHYSKTNTNCETSQYMNYIDASVPQVFIDHDMKDVGALKDGKDITIDTCRTNSAVSRMSWSDKMHSSACRQICWITPSGLVFEHTGLWFGRITETKLVELWGNEDVRGDE